MSQFQFSPLLPHVPEFAFYKRGGEEVGLSWGGAGSGAEGPHHLEGHELVADLPLRHENPLIADCRLDIEPLKPPQGIKISHLQVNV